MKLNAKQIFEEFERAEKERAELMPDETTALKVMFSAYQRLEELGFKNAIYCPKDGTVFEAIEAGSTAIGRCMYNGKWPTGHYWMLEARELWPSRPILFRSIKSIEQK